MFEDKAKNAYGQVMLYALEHISDEVTARDFLSLGLKNKKNTLITENVATAGLSFGRQGYQVLFPKERGWEITPHSSLNIPRPALRKLSKSDEAFLYGAEHYLDTRSSKKLAIEFCTRRPYLDFKSNDPNRDPADNAQTPIDMGRIFVQALIGTGRWTVNPPSLGDDAVEDAVLGGEAGVSTLRRRGVEFSPDDYAAMLARAKKNGEDGEVLINDFFRQQWNAREISSFKWVSRSNAMSCHDFLLTMPSEEIVKAEVKSTDGPFKNIVHISTSELRDAAEGQERYDLYRVYNLTPDGGKLRIARNLREFAKSVIACLALPTGVHCDGFSIDVSSLVWEQEISIPEAGSRQDTPVTGG